MTGINQDDRQITRRSTRRHVARVLLMPGRISNDELALRRGEVAIGNIDGDALLALRLQTIREQGRVEIAARRADGRVGQKSAYICLGLIGKCSSATATLFSAASSIETPNPGCVRAGAMPRRPQVRFSWVSRSLTRNES